MYKIVALDLDDTLLNSDKLITERNKEAIKKVTEMGVKVCITTGRALIGAMQYLEKLDLVNADTYVLCFNGALIYSLKEKKYISEAYLTGKELKEIYQEILRLDCDFQAYAKNQDLYATRESYYTELSRQYNKAPVYIKDMNEFKDDDLFIKCMITEPAERLERFIKEFNKDLLKPYSYFKTSPYYFEIQNINTSKGKGLIWLADHLGIDHQDTIAIGDSENDISMVSMAGLGCAMENAIPELKAQAKYITSDCNHSGVAEVLEKFIINKK